MRLTALRLDEVINIETANNFSRRALQAVMVVERSNQPLKAGVDSNLSQPRPLQNICDKLEETTR